jgi:hypothetical protein
MRRQLGVFIVAGVLVSAGADAGWSFMQKARSTGGRETHAGDIDSRVQIEGADARIEFLNAAANPMLGAGAYMLVRGAPLKGLFIVNPEKRTYTKFDPEGLAQAVAPGAAANEGAGMQMKVADVKSEKLLEEPGGEMQGLATMHYRYRKSYTMTMEMASMKVVTAHEIVEDVWQTTEIDLGGGFGKAMRKMSGAGVFAEIEKLSDADRERTAGFALKRITVDHSIPQGKGMMARMMGGKEETITTTTEVLELTRASIPASTFAIPAGFTETQLMQPGAQAPDLEDKH